MSWIWCQRSSETILRPLPGFSFAYPLTFNTVVTERNPTVNACFLGLLLTYISIFQIICILISQNNTISLVRKITF
jgi:hypothetical protein